MLLLTHCASSAKKSLLMNREATSLMPYSVAGRLWKVGHVPSRRTMTCLTGPNSRNGSKLFITPDNQFIGCSFAAQEVLGGKAETIAHPVEVLGGGVSFVLCLGTSGTSDIELVTTVYLLSIDDPAQRNVRNSKRFKNLDCQMSIK